MIAESLKPLAANAILMGLAKRQLGWASQLIRAQMFVSFIWQYILPCQRIFILPVQMLGVAWDDEKGTWNLPIRHGSEKI
jgi:hypothetical protein